MMYRYNEVDRTLVRERVAQFRGQVERRLSGELPEEEFRVLRLQNGLYLQRHAYMLRVAVPYGLMNSTQMRKLAHIARTYDRGYGHFTTRQNIQYNWPALRDVPAILDELADVEMHAIQTSGNCIRNITADHLAGIAHDEIADPRPYCEVMRQWSTFHPEFAYLPRKFKIAITGAENDRAAVAFHDIGLRLVRNDAGEIGFQIIVGGGMGRTPSIGTVIQEWVAPSDVLGYCEAILRVYNLAGDRANKYKARIKILVRTLGIEEYRRRADEEFARIKAGPIAVPAEEFARVASFFAPPEYADASGDDATLQQHLADDAAFARWVRQNVKPHREAGYHIAFVSLKAPGRPPGDITAEQMDGVADLADAYSLAEIRSTHDQNLLLPHVRGRDLFAVWQGLQKLELATPNIGTLADMICCPGLDYCDLANAGSIGVSQAITERFNDMDYLYDLGELKIKMSGCINACGHHHVGHIGILGINKADEEFYQIMLGGSEANDASLGKWLGHAIAKHEVVDALERLLTRYVELRDEDERLLDTYRRVGAEPFKEAVYGNA